MPEPIVKANISPAGQISNAAEPDRAREDIHIVARRLVKYNQEAEPGIIASYLFPDDGEIRLIHLDKNSPAIEGDTSIAPFYFGPDRSGDIPYPSLIALIRPEEKERLSLPEGWGEWGQAEKILPEDG